MKKIFLSLSYIFYFLIIAKAQSDDDISKFTATYLIIDEMVVNTCDLQGNIINATPEISKVNAYIKLISETTDKIVIRYLTYPDELRKEQELYNFFTPPAHIGKRRDIYKLSDPIKYFLVDKIQFMAKCKRLYDTWHMSVIFGSTLVPVKLRHSPFDFSKDFSLGPTIGIRFRIDKFSPNFLNLIYGFGITSVTIDSSTITNNTTLKANSDVAGISHALGLVGEFSNIQIGIFLGKDILSKKDQDNYGWKYNKKPWFSIGFGLTIFSNTKEAKFSRQYNIQKLNSDEKQTLKFQKAIDKGTLINKVDNN